MTWLWMNQWMSVCSNKILFSGLKIELDNNFHVPQNIIFSLIIFSHLKMWKIFLPQKQKQEQARFDQRLCLLAQT